MKKGTKLLSLLLAFVLVFALCGTAFAADTTAGEMAGQVVILHTNDVHGAITGYAKIAAVIGKGRLREMGYETGIRFVEEKIRIVMGAA